jgi:peptide/nickel transport system permease protein
MAEANPTLPAEIKPKASAQKSKFMNSAFMRVTRYSAVRIVMLVITTVIALYLTILVANMGGFVDNIRRAEIKENVNMSVASNQALRNLAPEVKAKYIADQIALQEKRFGMDKPFIARSFIYLKDAMTLNLGRALYMVSNSGSNQVRLIILERLPSTLLLFATSDIVLFFLAIVLALVLSRQYGSVFDKVTVGLTPLSSAPAWFYGIFFILIFASVLRILPFGGMVDAPPPSSPILYFLSLMKHMALPVLAYTFSLIFLQVFSWRTFFLIYSSEDYVDMAKAKGLKSRDIEKRYIMRPTLPTIITSFALIVIATWTGAPIFETIFNWPGMGRSFYSAIGLYDTPVIIGMTVIFAYLLAVTVLLLDFIYALVDPRVKIGGGESKT